MVIFHSKILVHQRVTKGCVIPSILRLHQHSCAWSPPFIISSAYMAIKHLFYISWSSARCITSGLFEQKRFTTIQLEHIMIFFAVDGTWWNGVAMGSLVLDDPIISHREKTCMLCRWSKTQQLFGMNCTTSLEKFGESYPVILVLGWPTPLKNDGVSNSWDDDIPFPFLNGKS